VVAVVVELELRESKALPVILEQQDPDQLFPVLRVILVLLALLVQLAPREPILLFRDHVVPLALQAPPEQEYKVQLDQLVLLEQMEIDTQQQVLPI
jgi:hypothetical protein